MKDLSGKKSMPLQTSHIDKTGLSLRVGNGGNHDFERGWERQVETITSTKIGITIGRERTVTLRLLLNVKSQQPI